MERRREEKNRKNNKETLHNLIITIVIINNKIIRRVGFSKKEGSLIKWRDKRIKIIIRKILVIVSISE